MSRLDRRAWEIEGLEMLGEVGLSGLGVVPLARRLGVSKGSFYWHFENFDDLLAAMLARWERVFTDLKYGSLEKVGDPAARLRPLFGDVAVRESAVDVFLALLEARNHPLVRPVFRRAVAKRLKFLERTFQELGSGEEAATDLAILLTTAYAGFAQMSDLNLPGMRSKAERAAFIERLFAEVVLQRLEG